MKKQARLGLILLVVAIIGWFIGVQPLMGDFKEKALTNKALIDESKSYDKRLSDIDFIKKQGDAVQKVLQSMYLALPKSSQVPETLVMIESIGASTGVIFTNASVGNPTGEEVPVSLSFSGNLTTTTNFLDALYRNVRTAIIKNQLINSDDAGNLSVSLQLGLVYQGGTQ